MEERQQSWKRFYSARNEEMSVMELDDVIKRLELAQLTFVSPMEGTAPAFKKLLRCHVCEVIKQSSNYDITIYIYFKNA
jgi:hypothetical protein